MSSRTMMPQAKRTAAGLPFVDARGTTGGTGADATGRSAETAEAAETAETAETAEAVRTGRGAVTRTRAHARAKAAKGTGTGVVTVIPYLTIVVCVVAGVYVSWHQGSHGGGLGGVIAGVAFLAAAVVRLMLPTKLAGFLASRNRATDVVTLAAFGVCLLLVGLLLPRLRDGYPHKGEWLTRR